MRLFRPSTAGRSAFTLIEMLVVLAIMATVMGLSLAGIGRDEREAHVRAAADELAAALRRARSLAMSRGTMYGIAFNLQNDPDSSGRILNNRSGGHWYRMIGPSEISNFDVQGGRLPVAGDFGGSVEFFHNLPNFPDFTEEVARCWVGERIVLPQRRVRFLALSDTDEGQRRRREGCSSSGNRWYGSGGERTYPRPWCGWWDASTGELWPWGGRGAGTAAATTTSAFWYQGSEPAFTNCRNPADLSFTQYYDFNNDYLVNGAGETVANYMVLRKDDPRPLVNADWLDAVIAFMPNGQAQFLEWNRARRVYDKVQAVPDSDRDKVRATGWRSNGVRDMAKFPNNIVGSVAFTGADGGGDPYEQPEVAHFNRHTGGWFVTLAPDALDDRSNFASAREAIASIHPAWRVFIGAWGSVNTIRVRHQEGALDGRNLWPADPETWFEATNTDTNRVWRNCRNGWLHQDRRSSSVPFEDLIPRGRPVTDLINTRIIANRQWWIDE